MSDPLASLLVPHIYQSTDAAINEVVTIPASGPYTYKLGTGLTPAYPANLPLIPSGAAPLNPPPAMTAGATLTTGALAANGNYQWAMTLVTKFGETTPGTILAIAALGAGVTGQTLNLPAGQTGTAAAPVLQRRIWRTKTTGSQLYLVAEIDDANVTTYVDEVSDTLLVTAAPTINSSGLEGAVALSGTNGAGGSTWTEIAPGASFTTAGQFQVDYTVSATGGVLTFGSLDAGKTPTANYTAAALLGSAYFAMVQAAFTALHSYLPQPGVAGVDSAGRLLGAGGFLNTGSTGYFRVWDGNVLHPSVWVQPGQGFSSVSNNAYWDGSVWRYELAGGASLTQGNGATLAFYTAVSGAANAVISWIEAVGYTPTAVSLLLGTTVSGFLSATAGLGVTGVAAVTGDIQTSGHLRVTGSSPSAGSFTAGAFGAGTTGNILGTDQHGTITVSTGSSPGTGLAVTFTFATPMLNTNYHIALTPQQGTSWRGFAQGGKTTAGWALYCDTAPPAGTTIVLDYVILAG